VPVVPSLLFFLVCPALLRLFPPPPKTRRSRGPGRRRLGREIEMSNTSRWLALAVVALASSAWVVARRAPDAARQAAVFLPESASASKPAATAAPRRPRPADRRESLGFRPLTTTYHITDLGTLGGSSSEANAINAWGHVVGWASDATGARHAFLYRDGTMRELGAQGGADSWANAINTRDEVVGQVKRAGGITAFHLAI